MKSAFYLERRNKLKDKAENLRDLLHYLKSDWLKNNKPDEYDKSDERCREELYGMVKDNVEYFSGDIQCNLNQAFYTIPISVLRRHKPSEICELAMRFNKSATGVYGFEFDNQTHLAVTDCYGNPFLLSAFSPKGYIVDCFEFRVYNMNGQGLLYSFNESLKEDKFTKDHLNELEKMKDYQKAYYDKIEASHSRYEEIKKCKDYISIKYINSDYAHCTKEVIVKKNIPIELSANEIAKYADGWNYCFGGSISKIRENDNETVYRVRINTD